MAERITIQLYQPAQAHAVWNALAVLELELRAEKFPATDTIEKLSKGRR